MQHARVYWFCVSTIIIINLTIIILLICSYGCADTADLNLRKTVSQTETDQEVEVKGDRNITFNWTWTEASGYGVSGLFFAGMIYLLRRKSKYARTLEACVHGVGLSGSTEANWVETKQKAFQLGVSKFLESKKNKILNKE